MGRVDVDAMLSELTPHQLNEWRAALDVLGLDDQWNQTAVLCQEMHRIGNASSGVDAKVPARKSFMPHLLVFKDAPMQQAKGKYMTPEAMAAAAKRRAGF